MGQYLTPGHTYVDGSTVNGPNLTEHVAEATFKTTAISDQTLKDPAALTDEILINDGGTFKKVTWQQVYALMIQAGTVIQTVYAEYTANTNLTTTIPSDNTIPQNTEGTEILSVSITPRFSTSTILAIFEGQFAIDGIVNIASAALFRGSVVNALASRFIIYPNYTGVANPGFLMPIALNYRDSPSTTSAVTYKIRVGPGNPATMRLNGAASGGYGGGSERTTLILQEIKV